MLLTLEQTRAACLGYHWESAIHDYMGMPRSTRTAGLNLHSIGSLPWPEKIK